MVRDEHPERRSTTAEDRGHDTRLHTVLLNAGSVGAGGAAANRGP